jgi:hypothetical protein
MTIDTRRERRKEGRLELPATAYVWLEGYELGPYAVDNLSVAGALLTGEMTAALGDLVQILLVLPGEDALELDARVVRVEDNAGSMVQMGIAFEHWSATAEDALREALYGATSVGEREAERESLPPFFESDDPDFVKIVPPPR